MSIRLALGLSLAIGIWQSAWKVHAQNFHLPQTPWSRIAVEVVLPWVVWLLFQLD